MKMFNSKKNIIVIIPIIGAIVILSLLLYNNFKPKCPDGYIFDGEKCYKIETIDPETTEYCDNGYELKDNSCVKKELIDSIKNYSCSKLEGSDQIRISSPVLSGKNCKYTYYHDVVERPSCPTGCYLNKPTECVCRFEFDATIMGTGSNQRLVCVQGYLSGVKCIVYTYPTPITDKICIEGFSLVNDVCEKDYYYDANVTLSCPSGYNLNGNYCEKELEIDIRIKYECPAGYNLTGKQCQKVVFVNKK